jgi:hypothetical protein
VLAVRRARGTRFGHSALVRSEPRFIEHDPATTACRHALHTASLGFAGRGIVQVLTDEPYQAARHLNSVQPLLLVADERHSVEVMVASPFLGPPDSFEYVGLRDVVGVDSHSRVIDRAFEEVDAEPRTVVLPFAVPLVNLLDPHAATGYAGRKRSTHNCRSAHSSARLRTPPASEFIDAVQRLAGFLGS